MSANGEPLAEQIKTLLRSMGRTPEEVADCLWLAAIRGVPRRDALANPVVRFLHERLDLWRCNVTIAAGASTVALSVRDACVEIPLPLAVRDFLVRFDERLYPELEAL